MRKRIVLILLLMLLALSLVACDDASNPAPSATGTQSQDDFFTFFDTDNKQWGAFWYSIDYFHTRGLSVSFTQNYVEDDNLVSLYGYENAYCNLVQPSPNDNVGYVAPNSYVYFQIPTTTALVNGVGKSVPFVEGDMKISIIDTGTNKAIASFTIYYTPPED